MSKLKTRTTSTTVKAPNTDLAKPRINKKKCKNKQKIRFDTVEIIELPIGLGDNPSVVDGPPISVSWDPQLRLRADLDRFESMRCPLRRGCRRLCKTIRKALIEKHGGFSHGDIDQAVIDAKKAKLERFFSALCQPCDFKSISGTNEATEERSQTRCR